jgi:hypothetical protein
VRRKRYSRVEIDAHLNHFATGDTEFVTLQLGSFDSLLLRRRIQPVSACDNQHSCRKDA